MRIYFGKIGWGWRMYGIGWKDKWFLGFSMSLPQPEVHACSLNRAMDDTCLVCGKKTTRPMDERLGARFWPLLDYIAIKEKGGYGWASNYEDTICGGKVNYPAMMGHYSMLLGLALDYIKALKGYL